MLIKEKICVAIIITQTISVAQTITNQTIAVWNTLKKHSSVALPTILKKMNIIVKTKKKKQSFLAMKDILDYAQLNAIQNKKTIKTMIANATTTENATFAIDSVDGFKRKPNSNENMFCG